MGDIMHTYVDSANPQACADLFRGLILCCRFAESFVPILPVAENKLNEGNDIPNALNQLNSSCSYSSVHARTRQ